MHESQRRAIETTATIPGYRYALIAALALAVAATGYFVLRSGGLGSRTDCDAGTSQCRPGTAALEGSQGGEVPGPERLQPSQDQRAAARPQNPRPLSDAPAGAGELRAGYTLAELCAAGLEGGDFLCQGGRYDDGTFAPSAVGLASRDASGETISGRVLTNAGTGLAGVAIVAAPERLSGETRTDASSLRFWTITDDLGAYSLTGLPAGEYTIRSRAQGSYPAARTTARTGVDYADLVVMPSLSLVAEGQVVTPEGESLEGVTVLPVLPGQPSVLTDRNGRFEVPVAVKPTVASFALRFQLPGFHEQTATYEIAGGGQMSVVMVASQAWTSLTGTVRSSGGGALAGRMVELRPRGGRSSLTATTDAAGRYAFPAIEAPADYELLVNGGAGHADHRRTVHVSTQGSEIDVVAEKFGFATVTGRLVNLSGEPVPDFELLLRNAGSRQPNALVRTDEDGNFEVPAVPAGRVVVASQSTPSIVVEGLELQAGETRHVPLVLDWGPHEIRGLVLGARGQPAPASRILLRWTHRSGGITTTTTRRTAADAYGRFAFTQLGPGPHSLQIEASRSRTFTVDHDVSRDGYELTVRLDDLPPAQLSAR